MQNDEINIPVPWGHLAAKTWGIKDDPMVLMFHGILDNAGSFDRLIPLLPSFFYYVCIDLPGHGRSSHFPPFQPIHTHDFVLVYKLIALYFGGGKYRIIGHSYGGATAFLFAQLYPEYVELLILLDSCSSFPIPPHYFKRTLRERIEYNLRFMGKLVNGAAPPQYTLEEALDKACNIRLYGAISREAAEALLPRAVESCGNGKFTFNFDQRLKNGMHINPEHDMRYIVQTLRNFPVECPVMIVVARSSLVLKRILRPVIRELKKNGDNVVKVVDGSHDVHTENPGAVAPLVSGFLLRHCSKL